MRNDFQELEQIVELLNEYAKEKFDLSVCFGTDFSFDFMNDEISVAFVVPEKGSQDFMRYFLTLFPNLKNIDVFMASFYHEVGHAMTYDELTEEEIDYVNYTKNSGTNLDCIYYGLPDEHLATEWAGNYISAHKKEVKELWKKIFALLTLFYNRVELVEM